VYNLHLALNTLEWIITHNNCAHSDTVLISKGLIFKPNKNTVQSSATEEYDTDFDVVKLFAPNLQVAQIYTLTNGLTRLALNTLPNPIVEGKIIPLSVNISNSGTY